MKPEDCILYSGAANGAEAAFGAAAERHGIAEVNFTFEDHNDARTRGIRVLTAPELKQGDVSLTYVSRLLDRKFRDTRLFRLLFHLGSQSSSHCKIFLSIRRREGIPSLFHLLTRFHSPLSGRITS